MVAGLLILSIFICKLEYIYKDYISLSTCDKFELLFVKEKQNKYSIFSSYLLVSKVMTWLLGKKDNNLILQRAN